MSNVNTAPPGALELLEKIKTLDGNGSGLDADLLKGKQIKTLCYNHVTNTINESTGIASVTDNGTGKLLVTFSVPFANENWKMMGTAKASTGGNLLGVCLNYNVNKVAGSANVDITNGGGTANDSYNVMLVFIGE